MNRTKKHFSYSKRSVFLTFKKSYASRSVNRNAPPVTNGETISQSAESAIIEYTIIEPVALAPLNTMETRLTSKSPYNPQFTAPTITKIYATMFAILIVNHPPAISLSRF